MAAQGIIMDPESLSVQIILVLLLTFVINLISTLSYSVRIVGIRTRKIAISFALFNIMVLISRTSNSFQAPLLAKWIEKNISMGVNPGTRQFQLILITTTLATLIGSFLIPTFQRLFSKAVLRFSMDKSVPKLVWLAFSKTGMKQILAEVKLPDRGNYMVSAHQVPGFPLKIFIFNIIASAILAVGVLSSLYAGFINPELRTTSSTLSSIVNGLATILMFMFIDPHLSALTDDVIEGKYSETNFRKVVRLMVVSRFIGTLLAQFLLVPFSKFIAIVANGI
jgi:hypothetical protein